MFTNQGCFILGLYQNRPPIYLGSVLHGLYNTRAYSTEAIDSSLSSCNTFSLVTMEEIKLWHLWLGHLPFAQLQHIALITSVKDYYSIICQICPAIRESRNFFLVSDIKTICTFQLLHIDIWGPYKTKSLSGCTQLLTIVDIF